MNEAKEHISPFEYYNGLLCVQGGWLYENRRIMSKPNYDKLYRKGKNNEAGGLAIQRQGGGRLPALIAYESIPDRYKKRIVDYLGVSPYELYKSHWFEAYLRYDAKVFDYYHNYLLPTGKYIDDDTARKYATQVMFLNALSVVKQEKKRMRKVLATNEAFDFWQRISVVINRFDKKYRHGLPEKHGSLRNKYSKYRKEGYDALISGKHYTRNRQKITPEIESLIVSLYTQNSKPYANWVKRYYDEFIEGKRQIINHDTGEIYNPKSEGFTDKEGNPVKISERSIWNILRKIENLVPAEKKRNDRLYYDSKHRPHRMMYEPNYSISLLSLDDSDAQVRLTNGIHPKRYLAFDVKSNAVVGWAVSANKDKALFFDMLLNMFRNLQKWQLGMPLEIQVEHHLVKEYRYELEEMFPFVTFANPGVAREKYAETLNRLFKYSVEKEDFPVGRHYAKNEANRIKEKKYWDAEGMHVKEQKFTIPEYREILKNQVERFNNMKRGDDYGEMSRLDVLKNYASPMVQKLPMRSITRMIGYKSENVKIRNNQYVRTRHTEFWIKPEVLNRLQPNNYLVDVYYLPDENDVVQTVYLYQKDKYIGEAEYIPHYNRAQAERTEKDAEAMKKQEEYLDAFSAWEKENRKKIQKVHSTKTEIIEQAEEEPAEVHISQPVNDDWDNLSIDAEEVMQEAEEDF